MESRAQSEAEPPVRGKCRPIQATATRLYEGIDSTSFHIVTTPAIPCDPLPKGPPTPMQLEREIYVGSIISILAGSHPISRSAQAGCRR